MLMLDVHFESTESLSRDSSIITLKKFIQRKYRVRVIYADNGTNFVGINKASNELDRKKIMEFSTTEKSNWKFNSLTVVWEGWGLGRG